MAMQCFLMKAAKLYIKQKEWRHFTPKRTIGKMTPWAMGLTLRFLENYQDFRNDFLLAWNYLLYELQLSQQEMHLQRCA